jgi:molybdopterin/thiamine biosynthesis adenylyltransferase
MIKTPANEKIATTLRITEAAWQRLCEHHRHNAGHERCSAAFGRVIHHARGRTILVTERDLVFYEGVDYKRQSRYGVEVAPQAVRRLLWAFAQSGAQALITIHDHFFDQRGTRFSGVDDQQDLARDRYLRKHFEPMLQANPDFGGARDVVHLNMVFDQSGFDARVTDSRTATYFQPLRSVQVIGERWQCLHSNGRKQAERPALAAQLRQRDFISDQTHSTIAKMAVAIVGCGGLGPMMAESLARLGFGRIVLLDPDRLEESNLNRWLAGEQSQVGERKVDILATRLKRAMPQLEVIAAAENVLDDEGQSLLTEADLLIGAVDCAGARFVLNKVATQHLIPYFDLGVLVNINPLDFQTRVTPIIPGHTACLQCHPLGLLDKKAVASALDGSLEKAQLSAGYVPQLQASAPSVMGLNLQVAGAATLDIISYLTHSPQLIGAIEHLTPLLKTTRWRTQKITALAPIPPSPDCPCCTTHLGLGSAVDLPHRSDPMELPKAIEALDKLSIANTVIKSQGRSLANLQPST